MTTSRGDGFVSQVDVDPASGDLKISGTAVGSGLTAADLNAIAGSAAAGQTAAKNLILSAVNASELQYLDRGSYITWFTDFLGDTIPAECAVTAGGGTGNAVALDDGAGGRLSIKSASDDGAFTANASAWALAGLDFTASQGLTMEARIKCDDVSEAYIFIGFTDVLPGTTLEQPIFLVAGDIDSDATDAVGVAYDIDGTTSDFWFQGGVKNGTDTVPDYHTAGPADNTYQTIRVEVSTAGAVTGYVDGTAIGSATANAVTTSVALAPVIVVANRSANAVTCLVDYVFVQAGRS